MVCVVLFVLSGHKELHKGIIAVQDTQQVFSVLPLSNYAALQHILAHDIVGQSF